MRHHGRPHVACTKDSNAPSWSPSCCLHKIQQCAVMVALMLPAQNTAMRHHGRPHVACTKYSNAPSWSPSCCLHKIQQCAVMVTLLDLVNDFRCSIYTYCCIVTCVRVMLRHKETRIFHSPARKILVSCRNHHFCPTTNFTDNTRCLLIVQMC